MTEEVELDVMGRRCPVPVIELAKLLPTVPVGSVVVVLTDDAAAKVDIPVWCRMKGQEYVGAEPAGSGSGTAHRVRRIS